MKQQTSWSKTISFAEYQTAVRARSDLTNGAKDTFNTLVRHADHKTGFNCAPEIGDMATESGRSRLAISRHIRQLRIRGVIVVIPLRTPSGRWNRNGYQFVGHGFVVPMEFGKLKWLKPSRTWHRGVRPRGANGRFACGPNVTIGCGPNVTIGGENVWTKSDQSRPCITSDHALDPSAQETARGKTPVKEQEQILAETKAVPTPERKTLGVWDNEQWYQRFESQLDDEQRRQSQALRAKENAG